MGLHSSTISVCFNGEHSGVLTDVLGSDFSRNGSRQPSGYAVTALNECDCIGEGGGRYGLPYVVEIVPVQAGGNVGLAHSSQIVVHLEPFLVHQNSLYMSHKGQLSRGHFLNHVAVRADNVKPCIVKGRPVIHQFQVAQEVSPLHVEGGSQHVNIEFTIVGRIHEEILVISGGIGMHAGSVIAGGNEGQLVGNATELCSSGLVVSSRQLHHSHLAIGDGLNHQVLEQQVFIVLGRAVQGSNQLCDKVSHAVGGSERLTKVFILNGHGVLNFPVDCMESRANVRERTLQLSGSSLFRGELSCFGQVDEHFLDRLAHLQKALFQLSILVVEGNAVHPNKCDTIYQSRDKFVRQSGVAEQHITDDRDFRSLGDFRHLILVRAGSVGSDSVQNVHGGSIQRTHCDSFRHNKSSFLI
nr:MAG TPA: hypothetical protein [Caudoviricetes sp.]